MFYCSTECPICWHYGISVCPRLNIAYVIYALKITGSLLNNIIITAIPFMNELMILEICEDNTGCKLSMCW